MEPRSGGRRPTAQRKPGDLETGGGLSRSDGIPASGVRRLQRLAGNRAVNGLLRVQRHPSPTTFADVGITETGGGGAGARARTEADGGSSDGAAGAAGAAGTESAPSAAPTAATPAGDVVTPEGETDGATATAAPAGPDYAALATRMQTATEGLGTDEDEVFAVLREVGTGASAVQAFREAYIAQTGRSLDADLADDMGGIELAIANALMGGTREERIRAQMSRTADGQWALGVINDRGIPVDWEYQGTGSYHSGGSIYLNYRTPAPEAAVVMVHEAQHAETYSSGNMADASSLDRETFVQQMIADEAAAAARQMEASLGMMAEGDSAAATGQPQWMVDAYKAAYDAEVARLRAGGVAEDEIGAQAKVAVRDGLVTNWFKDGTYRTSTSGTEAITYEVHYQREWDRINNVGSGS